MAQVNSRVKTQTVGDVTIVELMDKKILDEMNIRQIGQQLEGLVAQAPIPRLVLDFVNVAHMSSSALGTLITLHKHVRDRHGRLALCNVQPAIQEVFTITRLAEIFNIVPTREQALAAMQSA